MISSHRAPVGHFDLGNSVDPSVAPSLTGFLENPVGRRGPPQLPRPISSAPSPDRRSCTSTGACGATGAEATGVRDVLRAPGGHRAVRRHGGAGQSADARKTQRGLVRRRRRVWGIPSPTMVTRYDLLVVLEETVPDCLRVTARSTDNPDSFVLRHRTLPIEAAQFHPESIGTDHRLDILRVFAGSVATRTGRRRRATRNRESFGSTGQSVPPGTQRLCSESVGSSRSTRAFVSMAFNSPTSA